MQRHEKKVWPEYFQAILDGRKTFEVRLADWNCEEGDTLILKEWDPKTKDYTGREIEKKAGLVFRTKGQEFFSKEDVKKYGFMVISLTE